MRAATIQVLGKASASTPDLAKSLGLSKAEMYSICRQLEAQGLLASKLSSRPGLYCVDDGTAVTGATYDSCKDEGHDVRTMSIPLRIWTSSDNSKRRERS